MNAFADFRREVIAVEGIEIHLARAGSGNPLLLLHGYPQTHWMWHKIAPWLATDFTVIATDLRGYGDSAKPIGEVDHRNYSKRVMARDQVNVMTQLGYEQFAVVGHDRGARVAHRMVLDYPDRVSKLALLDIIPTAELYATIDQTLATAYYHWFFLIQPSPLPETLIGANPQYYLQQCLKRWSYDFSAFTPAALAEYQRCFQDPATIHATCEDYRAAATIDLIHDHHDRAQRITCPLLVLWGNQGIIGRKYEVLSIWQQRAIAAQGNALPCGHFLPEETPQETYQALRKFLLA